MKILRQLYNGVNIALHRMPAPLRRGCIELISHLPFSVAYPRVFMVEPTNICNGLCPLCPIGEDIDNRKKGQLNYRDFVRLVDEIKPYARAIIMNFAGEPILNPDIGRIAAYAESNGIKTIIGTNGTRDKSEELVSSGASEILYSLDGATEETYVQYRTYRDGTTYRDVVDNLRKMVDKKREMRAEKPAIILQFVVFKHNQHEIEDIMKLGQEIGVDGIDFKPVCINDFFESSLDELVEKFKPAQWESLGIEMDKNCMIKPPWCSFSFHETEILWNGDVTACCYDYDGDYVIGNVFTDGGFGKIWKSRKYRELRKKIVKQDLKICRICDNSLAASTRVLFTNSHADG